MKTTLEKLKQISRIAKLILQQECNVRNAARYKRLTDLRSDLTQLWGDELQTTLQLLK